MGGLGSTRWAWRSTKDTVERTRSLDINGLNRAGCLRPGYRGGWEWRQGSDRVARITLRQDDDRLILSYRVSRNGGKWRDVEQPTQIVWMPCHLGGQRPYFLCPGIVNGVVCNRWVTKLYGAGDYFLCRHCYRLAYASQRENGFDRAVRRANKIRAQLGGDASMAGSFPERPKGMHHKTYARLYSKLSRTELQGFTFLVGRLGVTPPWLDSARKLLQKS
jgi:hypothetical protein